MDVLTFQVLFMQVPFKVSVTQEEAEAVAFAAHVQTRLGETTTCREGLFSKSAGARIASHQRFFSSAHFQTSPLLYPLGCPFLEQSVPKIG